MPQQRVARWQVETSKSRHESRVVAYRIGDTDAPT
jgi:hypothetical protein